MGIAYSEDVLVEEPDEPDPQRYDTLAEAMLALPAALVDGMKAVTVLLVYDLLSYIEDFKLYLEMSNTRYSFLDDPQGGLFLLDRPLYDLNHAEAYLKRTGTRYRSVDGPAGAMLRWP